ncbi:hypothetical protein [Afipia sp. Root123D2]|uniref:hypothetical protein n=1 Tax=Afipia sp. Root123D2 TaxID=1736436 RepID=UPI000AAC38D3|nr:hypothetical protein [Afipia sp. Root123D2]
MTVRHGCRRMIAGVAMLLALAAIAQAEPAADPLGRLLTSKSDSLCYRRDYDAAHLASHPGQLTERIVLSFRQDAVRIELRQKSRKPRYIVASCAWAEHAGRDVQGKRLIAAFRNDSGFDCIVMVSPSSAEEGGYALLDPAPDGRMLKLFIDEAATVRDSLDKNAPTFMLNLGREDRVFQLTRTSGGVCKPMEDALEGP